MKSFLSSSSRVLLVFVLFLPNLLSQKNFTQVGDLRFFDFESPHLLSLEEIKNQINERREIYTEFILNEAIPRFELAPVYIENNQTFNFTEIVVPVLEELDEEQDPDFLILTLIRIMFLTDEFNEPILEAIKKIKLWMSTGETLRIYWTENHQIMYTSAAYLLRQKFGEEEFEDGFFDDELDNRLNFILDSKPLTGMFEFNSPIYSQFSLSGLLNLFDFAEDESVRERAFEVISLIMRDWMEITNNFGVSAAANARSFQFFWYADSDMFGNGAQQFVSLVSGLGPLIDESSRIRAITTFLVLSDIDLSEAVATYSLSVDSTKSIGVSLSEEDKFFSGLTDIERKITRLTMGTYNHPDYFNSYYDVFDFYNALNHDGIQDSAPLFAGPTPGMRTLLASLVASRASGSLYIIPELVTHKNNQVVLTSLNNYLPGFKGYQQFNWMISIGNVTVFTHSMSANIFRNAEEGNSQTNVNNQMPFLKQKQNVLLAIYNPNADLELTGVTDTEILLYFDFNLFDDVREDGNWLFGTVNEGFVGIFRGCVSNFINDEIAICEDKKQVWMAVVGNNDTHSDFTTFVTETSASSVNIGSSLQCISVFAVVDGKAFDESFCRNFGNLYIALCFVILYLVLQCICCCFCCRRCYKKKYNSDQAKKDILEEAPISTRETL